MTIKVELTEEECVILNDALNLLFDTVYDHYKSIPTPEVEEWEEMIEVITSIDDLQRKVNNHHG